MKILYLSLVVSMSLPLLVGCGGGSQMGGGKGEATAKLLHQSPALRKAGISHPRRIHRVLKPLSLCRLPQLWEWHTSNPSLPPVLALASSVTFLFPGPSTARNLSVKSSPVSGLVLFLSGVLASDRASVSSGSYHFTGGCAAQETGTLAGVKVKPLTVLFSGNPAIVREYSQLSTQLTQATMSDQDGLFPLTGTVTLANMCDGAFTLNGASVVGEVVHLYSNSGTGLDGLTGVTDSEAQQIELDDYLYSDDCIAGAHGLVTRQ